RKLRGVGGEEPQAQGEVVERRMNVLRRFIDDPRERVIGDRDRDRLVEPEAFRAEVEHAEGAGDDEKEQEQPLDPAWRGGLRHPGTISQKTPGVELPTPGVLVSDA